MQTLTPAQKWRLLVMGYVGLMVVCHFFRAIQYLPPVTDSWWYALLILKPTVPLWIWRDEVSPDK